MRIISHGFFKNSFSVAAFAIATQALVPKLPMCFWRCNTWIRLGLFLMCLPARPTAVCFRDRQGPWATLSSRCYCLPRWARTPRLPPLPPPGSPSSPFTISSPLSLSISSYFSLASLCLCSAGTCGPTEALGYTKKTKLAFICSLLPAVCIVRLCSRSAQKKSIDFTHDNVIIIIGFDS